MKIRFPPIRPLYTRDLVLREFQDDDAEAYFAICSDPEVMRTWGTPVHRSIDETRKLIAFLRGAHAGETMLRWAMVHKQEGVLIGDVGYWRFVKERARAEIGMKLARAYWSRGFMTQALTAAIRFGFEEMGLHSVEANVDPTNGGGVRTMEKAGFVQEGLVREHTWIEASGVFVDTALFSVVQGRWQPNPEYL